MTRRTTTTTHSTRPRRARREGAAMLVVLLVLLMVTSTAIFAIHSTSSEIAASGHARQAVQTRYVAEGALTTALVTVDAIGPQAVRTSMEQRPLAAGTTLSPEEPALNRSRTNYRIAMTDLTNAPGIHGPPVETDLARGPSLGRTAFQPSFTVDMNDNFVTNQTIAGHRADGQGNLQYMVATYTARGRTAPAGNFRASGDTRDYHETAINARAIALSGPIGR